MEQREKKERKKREREEWEERENNISRNNDELKENDGESGYPAVRQNISLHKEINTR